jgi:hypothetical protein
MPRHRSGRLVALLGVIAGVVGITGLSYAAYQHAHEGERVKRAANRLSSPGGWKLVGVTEESGSPFLCIVSCPHPEVTKVYRTDAVPLEACGVIKAQVSRQIARPKRQTWDAGCGWRAPLDHVGAKADVRAFAQTGSRLRTLPANLWPGIALPTDNATYVFVTFSGGPT